MRHGGVPVATSTSCAGPAVAATDSGATAASGTGKPGADIASFPAAPGGGDGVATARSFRIHGVRHRGCQRAAGTHDEPGRIAHESAAVRDEGQDADGRDARCGGDERNPVAPLRRTQRRVVFAAPDSRTAAMSSRGGITSRSGSASRVTGVNGVAGAAMGCASRASVQPHSSDCANSFSRTCALVSTISAACGRRNVSSRSCASRIFRINAFAASYRCAVHPQRVPAGTTCARPEDSA